MALSGAAFTIVAGGDRARAQPLLEQSLPLYHESGDPFGAAQTAAVLGYLLARRHEDDAASELLEDTLGRLRAAGRGPLTAAQRLHHLLDLALADNFLGQIRLRAGDPGHAAQLFSDGLAAARSAPDRFTILVSLYDLALSRQAAGDLTRAAELLDEGLSLADGPATSPARPTTWRPWPAWPAARATRRGRRRCWPRPRRSSRPAAAAGCTPTCPARTCRQVLGER